MCGEWRRVSWLVICLLVCGTEAVLIKPCGVNGTIQVEENTKDFLLACDGLSSEFNTYWLYEGRKPSDSQILIGNCSGSACDPTHNVLLPSYINPHTGRSHMILPDVLSRRFPDGTWWCQNGEQSAQCAVDVIHKANDIECSVNIDEGRRMVTGECQISKMYSSHGDYSCTWSEGLDNQIETEIQSTDTQLSLTNCSEEMHDYVCGHCAFQKSLPFISAGYRYRVVISPGSVSPTVRYVVLNNTGPITEPTTITSSSGETSETDRLYEGIGIGLGVAVTVVILVIIIVCVVIYCRHPDYTEKLCGDTPEETTTIPGHGEDDFPRVPPQPGTAEPPRISTITENEYSIIPMNSFGNSGPSSLTPPTVKPVSNGDLPPTYLHPQADPTDSATGRQSPSREKEGNVHTRAGRSVRTLPDIPAENDTTEDDLDAGCDAFRNKAGNPPETGYEVPVNLLNRAPEAEVRHAGKEWRDGCNADSTISLEPQATNGYAPFWPPRFPTSAESSPKAKLRSKQPEKQHAAEGGRRKEEKEKGRQEEPETGRGRQENRKEGKGDSAAYENDELATGRFIDSAFREKEDAYMYMKNATLTLSEPI